MKNFKMFCLIMLLCALGNVNAQHSIARQWNEALLEGIRNDFARPTVHARNLFHSSAAMWDAWAAYDSTAKTFFLGDTVGGYYTPFTGVPDTGNISDHRNEAISFAMYRLMRHRFKFSPGRVYIRHYIDSCMVALGYDTMMVSTDYSTGSPAALGNYIAQSIIDFGLQDGSNEQGGYANSYYNTINDPLIPISPGNPDIGDPNRWQPLTLDVYIDQSGNIFPLNTPSFLSPEWGDVVPFSMDDSDKSTYMRDGDTYQVWRDVGPPPYLDTANQTGGSAEYQWTFSLVAVWSGHLDPTDSVMWDISPASLGNIPDSSYPTSFQDYPDFYDYEDGGDIGSGYSVNLSTGQAYTPQMVFRGDYTRILAEFWADGPSSETPPGHWFTILNYVNDHPDLDKRWRGQGPVLDDLEWDVRSYFTLGGAMHDAAISAWSIKGWYDYIRPIGAIRYMADQGQSTDTSLSNYNPNGIPLVPGYIEVVDSGDVLAGAGNQDVGKIKLYAWRGPDYINDPAIDDAGVGWILAENWWPYQRPTFITPPFAGYISGHSTYSRAAAEILGLITGDEYFPGGMGEFEAPQNDFLVFEEGPSMDVTLQWAKYKDASDQCSLSRIWGGIHPPADDIKGRLLGMKLGPDVFHFAEQYMDVKPPSVSSIIPNPAIIAKSDTGIATFSLSITFDEMMDTSVIPSIDFPVEDPANTISFNIDASRWIDLLTYEAKYNIVDSSLILADIDVRISEAKDLMGNSQHEYSAADNFSINMGIPVVTDLTTSHTVITDADAGSTAFSVIITYGEDMDTTSLPVISFPVEDPLAKTLKMGFATWQNKTTCIALFDVADSSEVLSDIDIQVSEGKNIAGNLQEEYTAPDKFSIDMENPLTLSVMSNLNLITDNEVGSGNFNLVVVYSENMDTSHAPTITFPAEDPSNTLLNSGMSSWMNKTTYQAVFDIADANELVTDIDIRINGATDVYDNPQVSYEVTDIFTIDTENPTVVSVTPNISVITSADTGVAAFTLTLLFDEVMDTTQKPHIVFPVENPLANTLSPNIVSSTWKSVTSFDAKYDVVDASETLMNIDLQIDVCEDIAGNDLVMFSAADQFSIDMKPLGFNEPENSEPLVRIYPNPVGKGSILTLELGQISEKATIQLFNTQGLLVHNQDVSDQHEIIKLNTDIYPAGLYLVRIVDGESETTLKVQLYR